MNLSDIRKNAIENHCRLAAETINPRFGFVIRGGATLVLTVNSGYE